MKIENFYTATEVKAHTVFVSTVTCHINHVDYDTSTVWIKIYRCPYPSPQIGEGGIPQGDHCGNDIEIAKTLYPILNNFDNIVVM